MTTKPVGNDAIPGWGSQPNRIVTPPHDAATVMDGIKLGIGMAIAWLVLVPLFVVIALTVTSRISGS